MPNGQPRRRSTRPAPASSSASRHAPLARARAHRRVVSRRATEPCGHLTGFSSSLSPPQPDRHGSGGARCLTHRVAVRRGGGCAGLDSAHGSAVAHGSVAATGGPVYALLLAPITLLTTSPATIATIAAAVYIIRSGPARNLLPSRRGTPDRRAAVRDSGRCDLAARPTRRDSAVRNQVPRHLRRRRPTGALRPHGRACFPRDGSLARRGNARDACR